LKDKIEIQDADIAGSDAAQLLHELSGILASITGASGAASFAAEDVAAPRSAFVIAYVNGLACGCGALRPVSAVMAEIKRVYARPNTLDIGSALISALEARAAAFGYTKLVLETRKVNTAAVAFYQKHGYRTCPNFGKYVHRPEAICMAKHL